MNRRPLMIALALSLIGGGMLLSYLHRFEREASGGAPIPLLVAVKPIEPGTVLTEGMLGTREVPVAYVENRAVRLSEKARVLGLRVATPVQPQQALMWTDLAIAGDDRRDLSSLVEPGMRAVTIHARNGADRANQLIRPGDRVDVIVTTGQLGEQQESVVLVQNVLVLAVGLDTGSDAVDKPSVGGSDSVLTLSLTIRDAQLEALAAQRGTISVALRNPDDVRIVDGLSGVGSSALRTPPASRGPVALAEDAPPVVPVRLEHAGVQTRGSRR